jgi:hypothetical protein
MIFIPKFMKIQQMVRKPLGWTIDGRTQVHGNTIGFFLSIQNNKSRIIIKTIQSFFRS